jgi:signal transduction histidine kinase
MRTAWRANAAHLLLGLGAFLALAIAVATTVGAGGVLLTTAAWATAGLVAIGVTLAWLDHRQRERFRRGLAIGLTHHFRTSLSNILAYTEMLLLGNDRSEEERVRWLEIIGREAERVGGAVENVLALVNSRSSNAYPIRRTTDLGALLEDVACGYDAETAAGLRFEAGPPSGVMVDVDPGAIRHALGNLFHSLARVPGSGLSVALTANQSTATVLVGMDDADTARIAPGTDTMLREADLEGATDTGFGLELAIVHHVAKAHGGKASAFRDAGRYGYRFELPLSRA